MMLNVRKLLFEIPLMVIIDEREYADCVLFGILNTFLHEPCTDEIAEGLGSCPVSCTIEKFVKFQKEIGLDGDAEAD